MLPQTHIISHAESAPARSEDEVARKKVLPWALQIIDALVLGKLYAP